MFCVIVLVVDVVIVVDVVVGGVVVVDVVVVVDEEREQHLVWPWSGPLAQPTPPPPPSLPFHRRFLLHSCSAQWARISQILPRLKICGLFRTCEFRYVAT